MGRLNKPLASLASKLVHDRHREEAREETHRLHRTLARLVDRGIPEEQLTQALGHVSWESRLAEAMKAADITGEIQ